MSRKQCKKCPWKVSTEPREIPNGYCEVKHTQLHRTIAKPGSLEGVGRLAMMACHETSAPREKPCVGWIHHQLNQGNNLPLRIAAMRGQIDTYYVLDGPQHERFEDTLPN